MHKQIIHNPFESPNHKQKILARKPSKITSQRNLDQVKHKRNNSEFVEFQGFYSPKITRIVSKNQLFQTKNKNQIPTTNEFRNYEEKQRLSIQKNSNQSNITSLKQLQRRIFLKQRISTQDEKQDSNMDNLVQNKNKKLFMNKKTSKYTDGSTLSQIINQEQLISMKSQLQYMRCEIRRLKFQNEQLRNHNNQLEIRLVQYNKIMNITIQRNKQQGQRMESHLHNYMIQNSDLKSIINNYEFNKQKKENQVQLLRKQNTILLTKLWVLKQQKQVQNTQQNLFIYYNRPLQNALKSNQITQNAQFKCNQSIHQLYQNQYDSECK